MSTEQTIIAPELQISWSVVIVKEGPCWMAYALEHLTFGRADTQEEALQRLILALYCQVEADLGCGLIPFSLVLRGAEHYWQMFNNAKRSAELSIPAPLMGEVRVVVRS